MSWDEVLDGIDFGEGPRWHEGRLWFSDFYQHTISSVGDDGTRRVEVRYGGQPSGLGWLPDGRLLFVSMLDRRLMRVEPGGSIVEHANLAAFTEHPCNDMVVDAAGNAYVGNFGFDLPGGGQLATTRIALVRPDGAVEVAAEDSFFPNGSVITDDGRTLIVGETFGGTYTAYPIRDDATLGEPRVWAAVSGSAPDGCTIDAAEGIWFADAAATRVVRVVEGGEVTDTIETPQPAFACMLGGGDGRTLYALTAAGSHPDQVAGAATGTLLATTVDVPKHPTALP